MMRAGVQSCVFCRRPDEAVATLLAAKFVYRAIKTLIRLHKWEQALDIAVQNKTHVDTVLGYRQKFLAGMSHTETNQKFIQIAKEMHVDWDAVNAKIALEKENERRAGGARTLQN
eukprot:GDKI01049811.1.p1 GENE.GDKI01049811.1~~GDKI01049811.1.p1  ORF type:complete len:115 (-),score=29.82 GDKI01049811.1:158-502(-)